MNREAPTTKVLAILPLTFFLTHFTHHFSNGVPQNILWLCNFSNLVLSAGLFFRVPTLIRVSTMWLIPGVPLWLFDMSLTGDSPISTFLSHLGGMTIGILAMSKVRADPNMWIYAWLYGFVVQMACRLFTPPSLNVNVAFRIYYGFDRLFQEYWHYWIFNAVVSAIALWLLSFILNRIFPRLKKEHHVELHAKTA